MFTNQSTRQLIVAILLVAFIGALVAPFLATATRTVQAQAGVCLSGDLVTADKTNGVFKCKRQVFTFVGVNMRVLPHFAEILINRGIPKNVIGALLETQLKAANDMGVKVIRVFLPREDKDSSNHQEFINRLKMVMDFATDPGYTYNGGIIYSLPRSGPPPAPNMKFLVSLTDSIYDPGRVGLNSNLQGDRSAYVAGGALQFLRSDWYMTTGAVPNYTTVYRSYVEDVVDAFKADNRIFAWELGNEMFTNNLSDLAAFVGDMVSVIKDCTPTKTKCDPNHMVTTGFISIGHAIHTAPSPADIATIYNISQLDFGSIHGYSNEWSNPPCDRSLGTCPADTYNYADQDFNWFQANHYPYIVGELGFHGANPGTPVYPGGAWGTTPLYNTTNDRGPDIHNSINRFFDEFGADGVFQWAFAAGDQDPEDGQRGMDGQIPATGRHLDWSTLYQIYRCRSDILAAVSAGGSGPDIYIKGINATPVTGSNTQNVTVDIRNNNGSTANVTLNYNVVDASGTSIFSSSASMSNVSGGDSANVGSVTWLPTTTGQYTITAVIQSSSEPAVNTCNNTFTRTLTVTVTPLPTPTVFGDPLFGVNQVHVVNLPLGVYASIDRTKEEPAATVARPLANAPTLDAPAGSIWEELIAFFINLLPTYDYNDTQIDGISTYCYRARTYFLGIPLATSNEVCLPPAPELYPYDILSVSTIPITPSYKNLTALFDGVTSEWAIINYVEAEPVSVILEFKDRTTLSGFSIGLGGDAQVPNAYSLTAEAADTLEELNVGAGATYQSVVQDVPTPALEHITVSFPHNYTARFFKFTALRNEYSRHVHISELTPLLAATTPSGAIQGTIFANSPDPANGLVNAYVQVCTVGGACHVATTDPNGHYGVLGLKDGSYLVTAFPPEGSTLLKEHLGPLALSNGVVLTDQDLVLPGPTPPPSGTTITSRDTTSDGIPIVYWAEPLTLSTTGCPEGSARYTLTQDDIVKRRGSLVEGPAGTYTAELAPLQPIHGAARILITLTCPDGATEERNFDLYIDPSGVVRTVEGDPLEGATVTLYHADMLTGTFEIVPNGSALMSPMNRVNPDTTDLVGHFGWDVLAGYYRVRAAYPGCVAPDNAAQPYVESGVLIIPPPVTDLDLRLSCGETIPPTITATLSPEPNGSGWNHQDVTLTLNASDNEGGSGVCEIAYSATGSQMIDPIIVTDTTASILVTTEGQTTLTYLATDQAGNSSLPQTVTVQLDKTAPATSIVSPLAQVYTHTGSLNIAWVVTDTLSGVVESSGLLDGGVVTNGQTIDRLSLTLGAHTIVITATDTAGNVAQQTNTFTVTANNDSLIGAVQQACLTGAITRQEACVALKATLRVAQELIQRGRYTLARQVLQTFNAALYAFFQARWINQPTYDLLRVDALFVINTLPQ